MNILFKAGKPMFILFINILVTCSIFSSLERNSMCIVKEKIVPDKCKQGRKALFKTIAVGIKTTAIGERDYQLYWDKR